MDNLVVMRIETKETEEEANVLAAEWRKSYPKVTTRKIELNPKREEYQVLGWRKSRAKNN